MGHDTLMFLLTFTIVVALVAVVEQPVLSSSSIVSAPARGGGSSTGVSSFTAKAYPVRWYQSQPYDDLAASRSSFTVEAYEVKWYQSQPHDGPATSTVSAAPDVAQTSARGHDLHVEPGMLFLRKSLHPGAVLPEGTKLAGNGLPGPRRFVSRAQADAIPFSYKQLDTILRIFGIPRGSKKADQVASTLRTCEDESPAEEPHTCATSQQAVAAFAADWLGTRELRAVTTVVHGKEASRYAVAPDGVARIGEAGGAAAAVVPCHSMAYPYLVHYCHRPAGVEALRVELAGLGEDAAAGGATAIAMCHADTTRWDARYFEMLNATRGEEICHFMPHGYVLWLPAAVAL